MNINTNRWVDELLHCCADDHYWSCGRAVLESMYREGVTQKEAMAVISDAIERAKHLNESCGGRVLELGDIVVNWCQPKYKIWPDA